MDRGPHWLEPDPEKVVDTCAACGGEIYKGDEVLKIDDELIHDEYKCHRRYIFETLGAERIRAGEDD